MARSISGMAITVNGTTLATVRCDRTNHNGPWLLDHKTTIPTIKLSLSFYKSIRKLYAAIRDRFPGATIRYQYKRQRRRAA